MIARPSLRRPSPFDVANTILLSLAGVICLLPMLHVLALNMSSVWPLRDGFRDFMRWMNRLYHEGLVEREFATDTFEIKDRKIVNGEVGFFHFDHNRLYGQHPNGMLINLKENVPEAEVVPIEVFDNPVGEYRTLLNNPVRYFVFSPKKSKRPEAVVKYMNWLLSEEVGWTLTFGFEGDRIQRRIFGAAVSGTDAGYDETRPGGSIPSSRNVPTTINGTSGRERRCERGRGLQLGGTGDNLG